MASGGAEPTTPLRFGNSSCSARQPEQGADGQPEHHRYERDDYHGQGDGADDQCRGELEDAEYSPPGAGPSAAWLLIVHALACKRTSVPARAPVPQSWNRDRGIGSSGLDRQRAIRSRAAGARRFAPAASRAAGPLRQRAAVRRRSRRFTPIAGARSEALSQPCSPSCSPRGDRRSRPLSTSWSGMKRSSAATAACCSGEHRRRALSSSPAASDGFLGSDARGAH
jgi:hypothetical protein